MKVEESVVVDAPRRRVWRLVADPARYERLLGDTTWRPQNGHRRTGARYDVRTRVGAAELGGTVEIVEWTDGYDLAWASVRGLSQRGRWRLRDHTSGGTELRLRIYYEAPGGLLGIPGLLAYLTSAFIVRRRVRDWLDILRTEAETR